MKAELKVFSIKYISGVQKLRDCGNKIVELHDPKNLSNAAKPNDYDNPQLGGTQGNTSPGRQRNGAL